MARDRDKSLDHFGAIVIAREHDIAIGKDHGGEIHIPTRDDAVGVPCAESVVGGPVADICGQHVFAVAVGRVGDFGEPQVILRDGERSVLVVELRDGCPHMPEHDKRLRHLSADVVVAVSGQREAGLDGCDRHRHHQLDQGEPRLACRAMGQKTSLSKTHAPAPSGGGWCFS